MPIRIRKETWEKIPPETRTALLADANHQDAIEGSVFFWMMFTVALLVVGTIVR
jgi:hypothetical protein